MQKKKKIKELIRAPPNLRGKCKGIQGLFYIGAIPKRVTKDSGFSLIYKMFYSSYFEKTLAFHIVVTYLCTYFLFLVFFSKSRTKGRSNNEATLLLFKPKLYISSTINTEKELLRTNIWDDKKRVGGYIQPIKITLKQFLEGFLVIILVN